MSGPDERTLAQQAYEAYHRIKGDDEPPWDDVSEDEKELWNAVVWAIAHDVIAGFTKVARQANRCVAAAGACPHHVQKGMRYRLLPEAQYRALSKELERSGI